ncbi:MAG: helix-turn-helix transcriptional regulator, partial [Chlorobi bacterium]|nr:helix-turn-helix transcriptional regulator [Chlorobiota bacterium]
EMLKKEQSAKPVPASARETSAQAEPQTVAQRIQTLLHHYGLKSKSELAKRLGVNPSTITMWEKRNTIPKSVLAKLPDINPSWLLTGIGNPTAGPNITAYTRQTDHPVPAQEVPLYDLYATAGMVDIFDNKALIPVDTIKIPNLPKSDGAVFVTGDSMYPLLKSGDIVIFKKINDIPNDIFWGEMYILSLNLSGDEYITVKFVHRSDKGDRWIKLVSYNPDYQPKEIPLEKVRGMALIKASIRFNTMK